MRTPETSTENPFPRTRLARNNFRLGRQPLRIANHTDYELNPSSAVSKDCYTAMGKILASSR